MAIGFPPKYKQQITTADLNYAVAYISAVEAANKLGWKIGSYTENGFYANTRLSVRSWGERVIITINYNEIIVTSACDNFQITDSGKNKSNITKFTELFNSAVSDMNESEAEHKFINLKNQFRNDGIEIINRENTAREKKIRLIPESPWSAIIPKRDYYVTPLLVSLNCFIFLIMTLSGAGFIDLSSEALINWGGNFPPNTLSGDWWRLFTACFLHSGFIHLIMNMFILLYIGIMLESFLGSVRFLFAYILSGVVASIISVVWNSDLAVAIGASGAIFGMYGFFIAMLLFKYINTKDRKGLLISVLIFAGYGLIGGVVEKGVDNAAHFGGLMGGFVLGCINYITKSKRIKMHHQAITTALSVTFVIFCATVILPGSMSKEDVVFYETIDKLAKIEEEAANSVALINDYTPEWEIIKAFDQGIKHWDRGLEILNSTDTLDISDELKERQQKLKRYSKLLRKSYELSKLSVIEDTDEYDEEIEDCIAEAEQIEL